MSTPTLARRDFIKAGSLATGGLFVSFRWGWTASPPTTATTSGFEPNGFIRIHSNGRIVLFATNPEIGQGVKTSMPMILAEELDVAWDQVEVEQSDIDRERFGRQAAGGSRGTPAMWDPLRQAAATAKHLLVSAAAAQWGVPAGRCTTRNGHVHLEETGQSLPYGALAEAAARLPLPDPSTIRLKPRSAYSLLGKRITGVDNRAIVTGQGLFGIDERLEGMRYAVFQKCPHFGGKVRSANLETLENLPGIESAFILEGNGQPEGVMPGVAIVGDSTWSCFEALKRLEVQWDRTEASAESWSSYKAEAAARLALPGKPLLDAGDVDASFARAHQILESDYVFSFGSHANLEPQNCTAWYHDGLMEIWAPSQTPQSIAGLVGGICGIDPNQVRVHQKRIGGGFGRRLLNDYAAEAALIAFKLGKPVKLTWTREQDMAHDFLRVGGFHRIRAAISASGELSGLHHRALGFSTPDNPERANRGGGMNEKVFPYPALENCRVEEVLLPSRIPCGWWRAPGSCTLAWVTQSMLHEISTALGKDHLDFLLERFSNPKSKAGGLDPERASAVLRKAAEAGNWGSPLPAGSGRGLAFYFSHAGHFAEVVELRVDKNKRVTIDRVVAVGDVGLIVNLSGAENQVEGSIIDGLSMMAASEITFEDGRIEQSNFHDYPLLRGPAAPVIETYFLDAGHAPTGLGEPALPPLPPAVCNAIFSATGERIRELPIIKAGYTLA